MTIKVGDKLPAGSLSEYIEVESAECKIGPNEFKTDDLTRGKKVVLFGLPGAFTPTCSGKHVPGYVANYDKLKARGADEIICMSVNGVVKTLNIEGPGKFEVSDADTMLKQLG